MKRLMLIIIMTLAYLNVFTIESGNYFNPHYSLPSFFNPQNVDMSHTFSFSSSMSSGGNAAYQSMYTNHLKFYLHPKVDFDVDLNFVNYGTASFSSSFDIEGNNDNQSKVLPDFSLNYRPTENTSIRIEYRSAIPTNNLYHYWK